MVSKEKQAKQAATIVYRRYLEQKPSKDMSSVEKQSMHAEALVEAQKFKPDIDPEGLKHMSGYIMTQVNAEKLAEAAEAKKKAEKDGQGGVGASGANDRKPLDIKPIRTKLPDTKPVELDAVGAEKLGELEKRLAGMEGTVNNVAGAIQGLTEFLAKQTVTDNGGRSEQMKQIEARFPTFEVKLMLDTFRMSLFQAWKADHRFEGEIEDFLKDAFDEALRMRGANLEYTARRGSVIHERR